MLKNTPKTTPVSSHAAEAPKPSSSQNRAWASLKPSGWLLLVLCLISTSHLAGCRSTQTRPGVSESKGTYEMYVSTDQGNAWNASSAAVRELGYVVTQRDRPDGETWTLETRDTGANYITITIEPGTLEASRIAVHIDPGHNDSMSQLVLQAIRRQLKAIEP